jgi:hypothetical protein
MNHKIFIYSYTFILLLLTFIFVRRLLENLKSGDFEYLKLALNLGIMVVLILKIVRLSKIENQKNNAN